ncbi:MAG: histidine phosphatase family protein [Haloarculaceae archaeon]
MGRILLLRHGETDWNRVDRIQGWGDISLNERGRTQARAAGQFLATRYPDIDRVVSSDLPRAAETADAVVSTPTFGDLDVEYDTQWRERDFGVYQGHRGDRFFEENPEFAVIDGLEGAKRNVPEGGESYVEFRERVLGGWSEVRSADGSVLLVTHSGAIRTVIAAIEDVGIEHALLEYDVENGSITEAIAEDRVRLDTVNRVGHLSPAQ